MKSFKANRKRAELVILFSWIAMGLQALLFISTTLQLLSPGNETPLGNTAPTLNNPGEVFVILLQALVLLLSVAANITWRILLMMWFYRAYANLQTRLPYRLSYSPGMAVGFFFIPILNLFRPFQTMKELYDDTRELFERDGLSDPTVLSTGLVGWWWTVWIVSFIMSFVFLRIAPGDLKTVSGHVSFTAAMIFTGIVGIVSICLTLIVVREYSKVEPLLAELPEAAAPPATE